MGVDVIYEWSLIKKPEPAPHNRTFTNVPVMNSHFKVVKEPGTARKKTKPTQAIRDMLPMGSN